MGAAGNTGLRLRGEQGQGGAHSGDASMAGGAAGEGDDAVVLREGGVGHGRARRGQQRRHAVAE